MRTLLKFITCGSVDDGKSTLIGHLLYDSKLLYADQARALELDSKVGSRGGKIDYSLLLDGLMAEREQGITIDVAYRYFTTDRRSFIVADTPGHEEYTRNMAVGASFADLAVILVDASQGVLVQTRRHARICHLMGIRHFIFAVNKMDLVGYDEGRFREIGREIEALVDSVGLPSVTVIPLSATEGDNVTQNSGVHMPWYTGPSLLTALEDAGTPSLGSEQSDGVFVLPVQRVSRPDRTFRGFQGEVESGAIAVGDELTCLPSGEKAHVKGILVAGAPADSASLGDPVTVSLDREVDVSRGCVLTNSPDLAAWRRVSASLLWMDDDPFAPGSEYLVKLGTKTIPAVVHKPDYKIDVNTGAKSPTEGLVKNELARADIVFAEPIVADLFANHKTLGELILIDRVTNQTSACGVVESLHDRAAIENAGRASFRFGDLTARGDIFEEFVYDPASLNVVKYQSVHATYTVGDEIPIEGRSYRYPADFDILVLRDRVAINVRNKKITAILPLEDYAFGGVPVLNGRGFAVRVASPSDLRAFLADYAALDLVAFSRTWLRFDAYRKVS